MGALGLSFRVLQNHNHSTPIPFVYSLSLPLHYKSLGATSAYTLSPVLVYAVQTWILALGRLYHTRDVVFIARRAYVCPQEFRIHSPSQDNVPLSRYTLHTKLHVVHNFWFQFQVKFLM